MGFDLKKRLSEKAEKLNEQASAALDETIAQPTKTEASPAPTQPKQEDVLSPQEQYWQKEIYDQLLKVMDLTLIGSVEPEEVKSQIHNILRALTY